MVTHLRATLRSSIGAYYLDISATSALLCSQCQFCSRGHARRRPVENPPRPETCSGTLLAPGSDHCRKCGKNRPKFNRPAVSQEDRFLDMARHAVSKGKNVSWDHKLYFSVVFRLCRAFVVRTPVHTPRFGRRGSRHAARKFPHQNGRPASFSFVPSIRATPRFTNALRDQDREDGPARPIPSRLAA